MKAEEFTLTSTDNQPLEIARKVLLAEIKGLKDLLESLDASFEDIIEVILNLKGRVILSGIGKSGYIARKIASTLASTGTPAFYLHAAEAGHGDLGMITIDDIVILLSNSGETQELHSLIDYCKRFGIKIIGISRNHKSTLIRSSDYKVVLPASSEASDVDAPTTSTTMMVAFGDALAVALHNKRNFTHADFKVYHPGGNLGAKLLKIKELMHSGSELPLIKESETVLEAILKITSKRFGCVGVTNDQNHLIGMVTDGDLRRHMDEDILSKIVKDVMTHHPITLHPETLASECLGIMNNKSITNLFVVNDNNEALGIVHIHDLLRAGVV